MCHMCFCGEISVSPKSFQWLPTGSFHRGTIPLCLNVKTSWFLEVSAGIYCFGGDCMFHFFDTKGFITWTTSNPSLCESCDGSFWTCNMKGRRKSFWKTPLSGGDMIIPLVRMLCIRVCLTHEWSSGRVCWCVIPEQPWKCVFSWIFSKEIFPSWFTMLRKNNISNN